MLPNEVTEKMAVNITEVRILSVPLENDYKHTFYFSNYYTQSSYFLSKQVHSCDNFSYQRKDRVIRYPVDHDDLVALGANYVMYKNAGSDKYYYAFITKMEYVNEGVTHIHIETDVIQTWFHEYTVKPSFVEREHCEDDTVGLHTIEEGLEMGEFVCNRHSVSEYGGDSLYIVLGATKDHNGDNVQGTLYNNTYSGVRYYAFPNTQDGAIKLNEFLAQYDSDGIGEAITCMFMAPMNMIALASDGVSVRSHQSPSDYYINSSSGEVTNVFKALTTEWLDGYTPRNKKLLTHPYRYLLVDNNAGGSAIFRYERFKSGDNIVSPCFVVEGVITPGCSIRMVPLYYNGIYRNDEHGINMGKFPVLNWNSDVYTNWLTQNGVNIAIDIASGVGQIVAGSLAIAGTGGAGAVMGGGSIVGGVTQIANTLGTIHQQSFTPPQARGNLNSGDVVTATKRNDFHFYDMTVKKEFAEVIDEYFDMYGYKCHRVKVPAKNHRENYWFTKTIDANIDGNIPMEDMQKIKDCYNRGITFWKSGSDIGNYAVSNSTV